LGFPRNARKEDDQWCRGGNDGDLLQDGEKTKLTWGQNGRTKSQRKKGFFSMILFRGRLHNTVRGSRGRGGAARDKLVPKKRSKREKAKKARQKPLPPLRDLNRLATTTPRKQKRKDEDLRDLKPENKRT